MLIFFFLITMVNRHCNGLPCEVSLAHSALTSSDMPIGFIILLVQLSIFFFYLKEIHGVIKLRKMF